jgi:tripartite ATP-independent transporter DctM subunit
MIMIAVLTGSIFIGFPIAFMLIILAIVFGYIGFGNMVFSLMTFQVFGTMKEEVFAAIPLFVFMGHILEVSGLVGRLFKAFRLALAPMRGALYLGVLLAATIFATATGIVGASVTVIGLMAAPTMIKAKYDVRLSAGVITAGGTLGILIPPSVMLIVMGPVIGVSVIELYAAAIIPGVVLAVLYILYSMIRCFIQPEKGPPLPIAERATSSVQIIRELVTGILPVGGIVFCALGSILFGLATPTEAAAMGASGAVVLTVFYRRFNLKMIKEASRMTLETSSMILLLVVASNIFGAVFTRLGSGTLLANWLLALPVPPTVLLILIMLIVFLLGWPLEWPPIVLVFIPIFLPVLKELDFNLIWICILFAVNLQTAFLSPPVALSAYFLKAVASTWELKDIYAGMMVFMILQVIGLGIIFLFPELSTWLPSLLYK